MIVEELEQGSADWMTMRAGCCTASRMADVMSKYKRPPKDPKTLADSMTAARYDYLLEVAISRMTGMIPEHYTSKYMKFGIEQEPFARTAYEQRTDQLVETVGLAYHPAIKWFCASPDGLIDRDGILEIKCPAPPTHLEYLLAGVPPEEYQWQMLAQMACCERKWADFVSYCPFFPKNMRLLVVRFERDDKRIAEMEAEVITFLAEVDSVIARLPKA